MDTKKYKTKKDQSKFWERAKLFSLFFVSIGIIVGSFFLFWQIKKQNAPQTETNQNEQLRSEVESLNKKIEELNKTLGEVKSETETKVETTVVPGSSGKVAGESTEASSAEISGKVNLNTADTAELDSLPGIGPSYAQRIIEYRDANGGFKSIDEVQNVKGIGPKTFEKMKDLITV
jgi:comEA protein